jgi:radical SAM superfamily enzyme YgiQ (UPF0313 family)
MIKKITFIEPKNDHLHIYSRYELPRLGGILLATIMKQKGYQTEAVFMKSREILRRKTEADLIAISTITPTAASAYAVGDEFRKRGLPVVYGGPHVTFFPEEALEHGDYCIMGEGERAMPALLEALNGERSMADVPGLAWRDGETIRRNPLPPPVENLDELPFPDLTLLDMGGKKRLGSRIFGHTIIPIQTSRGCPFDCSFCSVTPMFGKRYRHRSTENIMAEISRYNTKDNFVFFYDDNFAANTRRTKELLHAMIDNNIVFKWSTQVRIDVARDPEILDLMVKAGCVTLYIGFESIDPESLLAMKKNQTVDEIRYGIAQIRKRRIHIHGMFVFGFDTDTPAKARATVSFALKEKIDSTQFMILTPLPGSELHDSLDRENRIIDRAWDTYDAHHVKFRPLHFTPWELQYAQIEAHTRFYSPFQVIRRLLRGRTMGFIVGVYAGNLNKRWQKAEKAYLDMLRRAAVGLRATVSRGNPSVS